MSHFKAKIHHRSSDPLDGFKGPIATGEVKREGCGGEGVEKVNAPKLLLNQDPSESCYATVYDNFVMLFGLRVSLLTTSKHHIHYC